MTLQSRFPPLPEQQRIVRILDEAFGSIATAKANIEKCLRNAREFFDSHLNSTFAMMEDEGRNRRLSEVCREITVGHVGPMVGEYSAEGIPFLRSQNIRPFEVTLDNVVFVSEAFHKSLFKSRLEPGDVAIVRTGYPGTAAVIPDSLKAANCSDLVIVRPGPEIDPHYLAALFNSPYGKPMVLGKLVGAAQKHFNVTAAKGVILHLPPIGEQRRIVARIARLNSETQRLAATYRRKLEALDALKQSLLHEAFSGQL